MEAFLFTFLAIICGVVGLALMFACGWCFYDVIICIREGRKFRTVFCWVIFTIVSGGIAFAALAFMYYFGNLV